MTPAPLPEREAERLALLGELKLPAAALEPGLAAIARMASRQTGCPMGAVSIVGAHQQSLYASSGARFVEQPRASSFSAHAILQDGLFEVEDLALDARFADHPFLQATPPIRFFAGMPVRVHGLALGTVSVSDRVPRRLDAAARESLHDLALATAALFEARLQEMRRLGLEVRVREASAAGSDWFWESDADGMLTWVSDSVEQHTGWPASREIGVHALRKNRPPPSEWRASWDRYRTERAARRPFRDAIAERDSAHGTMLIAISGQPVFDDDGVFRGYRGAARDVTAELVERQRAQREQQLLLQAIEAVHAGVMISGPDGRVRLSNASWQRTVGTFGDRGATWESLVRTMVSSGAYPDAVGREEEFVRWRLALASPDAVPHELRFLDQEALVTDQLLPDGSVVHLSINVTERRRAERELRASEARMAAVLGAVPDLWFVVDRDERYLQCSDDRHPWLIEPFDQLRGEPFGERLPSELRDRSLAALRRARESGQMQRLEYELDTPDGTRRSFEARVSPMPDGQVLYLTRDLTELRHLEREILVLQRALEADAAMPIVVADATQPDMPIVYVNPAFERLTGYRRAEVAGRNCRFLQADDVDPPALATLRAALARGEACTVILNNRRHDGSSFLNELSIAPIVDAQGRLVHYLGVLNDVTDRVRSAERLRISEDLYRSVAAAISDGLLVVSAPGAIIASNPSACEMLGIDAASLLGKGLNELGFRLHTEDDQPLPEAQHPVRRVLNGDVDVKDLLLLHRPDGAARFMLVAAHPLRRAGGGRPVSCLVTFRDVTDQRAAEHALAAAEERWKFALEGAGDGVWDYDEDTRTVFYSPRWKEMLGYAEHEVGNTRAEWLRRVHPQDKAHVLAAIRRYRRGETTGYLTEHRLLHRDGRWIWVLDRGKIVERRSDGTPRRLVGTHTDITRLKFAEQALLDKQAAELASRAKSEFLSRMSHEMRTPLNAVIGFTQLLRMQPNGGPAKVTEYADHVLRASEHLLALVNEVLDLQRVEEGRLTVEPQPIELAPFLDNTLDLLRPAAQGRAVALTNQVPRDHWILADARCLRQVLINVVSNAVKYNRTAGWVSITLLPTERGRCQLAVEDTGAGLSAEQLARLFQPFERLGHETSGIEGTGLGLVIARSLVEKMGGTLTLSSVPGSGTLARIDLPAATAPLPAMRPLADLATPLPRPLAAMRAPMRMLYVEDNRINALLFEEAMRVLGGFELRVAEDGAQAITLVQQWDPQVLVLDANLPDMTGFEVLRRLRERPALARVPAYMCSADAMPEDLQRAREAGFDGYWTKPIELAVVSADLGALRSGSTA